jgi:transcription elongation factor GreB
MSKAFTKEGGGPEEQDEPEPLPMHAINYMTPFSFAALQAEMRHLQREERPKVVEVVSWAAGNGDRSENGDYIYGKKRLREIDRRLRYLAKKIKSAQVVDPAQQQGLKQVFFGATVTYVRDDDTEQTVTIVGVDEADLSHGKISWISPVAKALMKAAVGDVVELRTPAGMQTLEVLDVSYRVVSI